MKDWEYALWNNFSPARDIIQFGGGLLRRNGSFVKNCLLNLHLTSSHSTNTHWQGKYYFCHNASHLYKKKWLSSKTQTLVNIFVKLWFLGHFERIKFYEHYQVLTADGILLVSGQGRCKPLQIRALFYITKQTLQFSVRKEPLQFYDFSNITKETL